MKIEKESDTLNREYKRLSMMMERLTKKGTWDKIEPAFNELHQRQGQIVKELEECTGIQITCPTREDTLKENERIQDGKWDGLCWKCHDAQITPRKVTGLCPVCESKLLGWKRSKK